MNAMIKVGPDNYMGKLVEHIQADVKESALALKNAQELVITNDEDLRIAKEDFVAMRDREKTLEETRKEIVTPLNDVVKQVNSLFKTPATAWADARSIIERKGAEYARVKEEARLKAEREAQEKARKEEERIRKEKEAQEKAWREKEEAKRREAEELDRKAQEEKNAEKRAEMEAQAEKARQDAAKAQDKANDRAIEAQNAFIPAPTIEKTEVKVAGAKKVTRYYAQVIDAKKVPVEWCGRILRPVDEGIISEIARGLKTTQSPIEGIRFYSEEKMA